MPYFNFPKLVFEDIKMTDFGTHNKKQVSEDFVAENFKELGFYTFRPHSDTGIDLIVEGYVCKNCHQPKKYCVCDDTNLIKIKRFIQIKTREVKGDTFGYTLKSKDFRTDPRHIFIFYSDYTNDFFILPMLTYLKIFWDNEKSEPNSKGKSHFSSPAFRKGNNKINSLKIKNNIWKFNNKDFTCFLNEAGLKIMFNTFADENINNFQKVQKEIKIILEKIMHSYSCGAQLKSYTNEQKDEITRKIKEILEKRVHLEIEKIKLFRNHLDESMNKNLSKILKESRNKYLKKFKGVKLNAN